MIRSQLTGKLGCRQGFNTPEDDIFTIEVQVQMSDISEAVAGTTWSVRLGVSNGEVSENVRSD